MSGGSFDYVSTAELFTSEHNLRAIRVALAEYPSSEKAVALLDEIIAGGPKFEALREVLRAVEWHHSSDYTEEAVTTALAKFNARTWLDAPLHEGLWWMREASAEPEIVRVTTMYTDHDAVTHFTVVHLGTEDTTSDSELRGRSVSWCAVSGR